MAGVLLIVLQAIISEASPGGPPRLTPPGLLPPLLTPFVFEVEPGLHLKNVPGLRVDNGGAPTVRGQLGDTWPDGTVLYQWTANNGYEANSFEFGAWDTPGQPLRGGSGFFIYNPSRSTLQIRMNLSVDRQVDRVLSSGLAALGTAVPLSVDLYTIPAAPDDVIYRFSSSSLEFAIFVKSWWFASGQVFESWVRWDTLTRAWIRVQPGTIFFHPSEGWFRLGSANRWAQKFP